MRSHYCGEVNTAHIDQTVEFSGWVNRRRDHGGVIFIDLRDHYGITQVLADPDSPVFAQVEKLRAEYCIRIDGEVKARDPELVNPKLPTGEIGVLWVRGPNVMAGYFDDPEATAAALTPDGWLRTGDRARLGEAEKCALSSRYLLGPILDERYRNQNSTRQQHSQVAHGQSPSVNVCDALLPRWPRVENVSDTRISQTY